MQSHAIALSFGESFKNQKKKTDKHNFSGHFRHTEVNLTLAHKQVTLIDVLIHQLISHVSVFSTVGEKL